MAHRSCRRDARGVGIHHAVATRHHVEEMARRRLAKTVGVEGGRCRKSPLARSSPARSRPRRGRRHKKCRSVPDPRASRPGRDRDREIDDELSVLKAGFIRGVECRRRVFARNRIVGTRGRDAAPIGEKRAGTEADACRAARTCRDGRRSNPAPATRQRTKKSRLKRASWRLLLRREPKPKVRAVKRLLKISFAGLRSAEKSVPPKRARRGKNDRSWRARNGAR